MPSMVGGVIRWTELCRDTVSIAVGSTGFIDRVTVELGARAKGREISGTEDYSCLREAQSAYYCNFSNTNIDPHKTNAMYVSKEGVSYAQTNNARPLADRPFHRGLCLYDAPPKNPHGPSKLS